MDNASKERLVRDGFGASSSLAASLRFVWMAFTARWWQWSCATWSRKG